MGSQGEPVPNVEDAGDASTASKFKKVFLKKRVDNTKEGPTTSSKNGESSLGMHKKAPYVSKLQKLRRKVRKTYPLMEVQENSMREAHASQRYVRADSPGEIANDEEPIAVAAAVPDNLSEIFEVERNHSPTHSVASSEAEIASQVGDDDIISYSYEASNSLPNPIIAETPVFEPYQPAILGSADAESLSCTEEGGTKSERENEKSYVYIDTSELFERPNLDGIGIQGNHLAPCLCPSENEEEVAKRLSVQLQGITFKMVANYFL